jgi:PAS domain S-box-containing protein
MSDDASAIHVLHVDDQVDFCELVSTFLQREDDRISVWSATSVESGLEVLHDEPVDCIISDHDFPEQSGIEFLQTVRETHPEIPFILYTGKGSEEVASEAISAGVTDYMQKGSGTDQYAVLTNRIVNSVDQYRAEQDAARNRQRLETLISNLPGIAYRCRNEREWPMNHIRGECQKMTGYTAEELEEADVAWGTEVIHPDDQDVVWDAVQYAIDDDIPFEVTYRIRTKDGDTRWMWERGRKIDGGSDDVERLEGFITDITDRVERERELEQYEAYLEESTDIITVLDEEGRVQYQSPATTRLLGYEPGDLIGENGFEYVHPDDVDELLTTFSTLVGDEGETVTAEARFRTADDDWRWLEIHGNNQLHNEAVNGIVTNNRDITERKQYEQELEETNTLLSTLIDTLPVGILAEDGSRNVLAANDRLVELFEFEGSPQELVGADCERLAEDVSELFADPAEFAARIDEVVSNKLSVQNEELDLADGRTFSRSHEPIDLSSGNGHLWVYRDITDRKNREERLRETSSRLEVLFDQSPDMINVHDGDGNIIDPNPQLQEKTGYSEAELRGMKVWALDRDIDRADAIELWERMDSGDRERLEGVYEREDGSSFPVEIHLRRLDIDGENRYLVISRDITERKERERELLYQNDLFRKAQEIADVGAWSYDVEADEGYLTEQGYAIHGLPPDSDIDPQTSLEHYHPDDRETIERAFERAIEDGVSYDLELRLVAADGAERWVRTRGDPLIEDGTVTRVRGTLQDISGPKERERQLQAERDRFRAVFEESFDAMVIANDDGVIVDANESASTLFGLPSDDLLGQSIEEFAPDDYDFNTGWTDFQQAEDERGEFPLVRPDGEQRIVEYAATANVTPGEHLSVLRDVTDRNSRARELERQNERLEDFASIVSHDLRNPLNVAGSRVELAQDDCDSEHLESAMGALERMETLIDDILTLARLGEPVGDFDSVRLDSLVTSCWANVSTGNATIEVDVDRSIRADGSRLRQLLENIIRNAVEHGGTDVTVRIGELDGGFYVEDDGPGIPPEDRDQIFEAGYSTSREGTGFGLSIAQEIIEAHGWTVTVTEGADGGARFEIRGVESAE